MYKILSDYSKNYSQWFLTYTYRKYKPSLDVSKFPGSCNGGYSFSFASTYENRNIISESLLFNKSKLEITWRWCKWNPNINFAYESMFDQRIFRYYLWCAFLIATREFSFTSAIIISLFYKRICTFLVVLKRFNLKSGNCSRWI